MPGRTWTGGDGYRYSHNGHEREDEIYSNAQSAEYWMYDSRIGRRWEIDPVRLAGISPFATFSDNPILFRDIKGRLPDKLKNLVTNVKNFFNKVETWITEKWDNTFNKKTDDFTEEERAFMKAHPDNYLETVIIKPPSLLDRFIARVSLFGAMVKVGLRNGDNFLTIGSDLIIWGTGGSGSGPKQSLPNNKEHIKTFDGGSLMELFPTSNPKPLGGNGGIARSRSKAEAVKQTKEDIDNAFYEINGYGNQSSETSKPKIGTVNTETIVETGVFQGSDVGGVDVKYTGVFDVDTFKKYGRDNAHAKKIIIEPVKK